MRRVLPDSERRGGFALLTVLLVLLSLLVLATPFLWTASRADATSRRLTSEVEVELALDTALRHARHELGRSHAGVDLSRFADSEEELSPRPELVDTRPLHDDPGGVMWSYETLDHSGLIDFDSAPPQLFANLLGQSSYVLSPLESNGKELEAVPGSGFRSRGILSIGREYIVYGTTDGSRFNQLTRGFLAGEEGDDGQAPRCGPQPASSHGLGAPIMGFDAWAIAYYRLNRGMAESTGRSLASLASELAVPILAAVPNLDDEAVEGDTGIARALMTQQLIEAFGPTISLDSGLAAGSRWLHPTTLLDGLDGTEDQCVLRVDSERWFNRGSTVRISQGEAVAYGLVEEVLGGGAVRLKDPVSLPFTPGLARVEVLARRPVNVNVASPEVLRAIFLHLKMRGANERITGREADQLVERILEQRPFEGLEDFIRRIVIPAVGAVERRDLDGVRETGDVDERRRIFLEAVAARDVRAELDPPFLDKRDGQAIVRNALNPNDFMLSYSTVPLSFTSRDLHEITARASVNAASGRQRATGYRRQVEWIAPQVPLLKVWTFQEDFDSALIPTRSTPGWGSGPETTTIADRARRADPPPRVFAYYDESVWQEPGAAPGEGEIGEVEVVGGVFPTRTEAGFAKPWHVRVDEAGPRQGQMEHFDVPRFALEGRRTNQQTYGIALNRFDLTDGIDQLGSTGAQAEVLNPFTASMWVRPLQPLVGTHLLDLGGQSAFGDRVELFTDPETNELVLRVLDGPGDHPLTVDFVERAEVRYPGPDPLAIAPGGGPLPSQVWSHVEVDVRGSRPDQLAMRVDGFPVGRVPGLTRLTAPISSDSREILVESTEGFPDVGPILIGEEVIEAVVTGPQSFEARFASAGPRAGYGGRLAREVIQYLQDEDGGIDNPAFFLAQKDGDHPEGTPVSIYGYTSPLVSQIPAGDASLRSPIGAFAVGRVAGFEAGAADPPGQLFDIEVDLFGIGGGVTFGTLQVGRGFDTAWPDLTELTLLPADAAMQPEDLMSAFSPDGGYAAVMQLRPGGISVNGAASGVTDPTQWRAADTNSRLAGLEIISYRSATPDGRLLIDRTGIDAGELAVLGQRDSVINGPLGAPGDTNHVFILEWDWQLNFAGGGVAVPVPPEPDDRLGLAEYDFALQAEVFVVPISLPVSAAPTAFSQPLTNQSEFAQIVETGEQRGATEWVRYDEVVTLNGVTQLVRDDPFALDDLFFALTRTDAPLEDVIEAPEDPNEEPIGQPGGSDGGGPPLFESAAPPAPEPPTPGSVAVEPPAYEPPPLPAAPAAATQATGLETAFWKNEIGFLESPEAQNDLWLTRAARTAFAHRGVLGTFSHPHEAGRPVTPVFRTFDTRVREQSDLQEESEAAQRPGWGWPGADDAVFVMDEGVTDPGRPAVVHRSVRAPRARVLHTWFAPQDLQANDINQPGNSGVDVERTSTASGLTPEIGFDSAHHLVALNASFIGIGIPSPEFQLTTGEGAGGVLEQYLQWRNQPELDTRGVTRLVKFPSGELPRVVNAGRIGRDTFQAEARAPAIVDEILIRRSTAIDQGRPGATLVLGADLLPDDVSMTIDLGRIRTPFGDTPLGLGGGALPQNGGLLRVGEELIAYYRYEATSGLVLIGPGGRGFLGTTPQAHVFGEPVTNLSHESITFLAGAMSAESPVIPVQQGVDFAQRGTVRIDRELMHFTNQQFGMSMPSAPTLDGEQFDPTGGRGIYRGRYGTLPEAHAALAPVIQWPTRHWDRFARQSDAPEQHFLGLELSQPEAWVQRIKVDHTDPTEPGARVGILVRSDPSVSWAADPAETEGLELAWIDRLAGDPLVVGSQSDDVEIRVFTEYQPGSFDPLGPFLHGWKEAPSIEQVAVDYVAPSRVLRRSDR